MKKGDVAMFIVEDDIKNELQLLNIATEQRNIDDRCLYDMTKIGARKMLSALKRQVKR